MVCEKCWADAALLARSEGTSQTEAYYKILARHNHDSTTRIRELEAQLAIVQDTQTIPPSDGGEFERVLKTHRMPAGNYVFSTEGSIFGIDNLTLAYKSDCAANKQHIAELEAALTAAQERNTALQSEHLDHVIALYDQLTAMTAERDSDEADELRQQLTKTNTNVSDLRGKLDYMTAYRDGLRQRLVTKQQQLAAAQEQLALMTASRDELQLEKWRNAR